MKISKIRTLHSSCGIHWQKETTHRHTPPPATRKERHTCHVADTWDIFYTCGPSNRNAVRGGKQWKQYINILNVGKKAWPGEEQMPKNFPLIKMTFLVIWPTANRLQLRFYLAICVWCFLLEMLPYSVLWHALHKLRGGLGCKTVNSQQLIN